MVLEMCGTWRVDYDDTLNNLFYDVLAIGFDELGGEFEIGFFNIGDCYF
jgi:hypothetical protein